MGFFKAELQSVDKPDEEKIGKGQRFAVDRAP
jgi:hypothetical protein